MPNRLIDQTSPYLLQHAHNPVDWRPWGEEALRKAGEEDKPIFLSIGYSACHWCHVMERESFEDEATAAVLNRDFVSVKVDREERPDLDGIYMQAVVAMTGHGGWPMSVFLTADGSPFYGGTYFPPEPRSGMPSFRQVLEQVIKAYRERRGQVDEAALSLVAILDRDARAGRGELGARLAPLARDALMASRDSVNGGWGGAPKFPQPMALDFLLRLYTRRPDPVVLGFVRKTLDKMARGGIYDHLGGGFHRYATDGVWLVPHFEKMLYDNSQLARVYLRAWQVTREPAHRRVAEETLDYVSREMTGPEGGFYSTQDADSEGEEGKFFVWEREEIEAALGDGAELFARVYGVTPTGNFEGRNILHMPVELDVAAHKAGMRTHDLSERLHAARKRLFEIRETRIKPGRDEKVLTSWNALMLGAFAEAGRTLGERRYTEAARRNARFLLSELRNGEGRLFRTWRDGRASLNGYLEDYSFLVDALLTLYEGTFETEWFAAARDLAEIMLKRFVDPAGGFFDVSDDHERLIARPKGLQDNALPSGGSVAALGLLRLAAFTGDQSYASAAEGALRQLAGMMDKYPTGFAQWLCALDFHLDGAREIAIIGVPEAEDARGLLDVVFGEFRPNQVVAAGPPSDISPVPLLSGRPMLNGATAYVCRNFACNMPVTDPEDLRLQLAEGA